MIEEMHLRNYQRSVVNAVEDSLKSHLRVVVACPTGSGKTVLAIHGIIPKISGRVAWVTHRRELANQVGQYSSGLSVFMVQKEVVGKFDAIIIDEGHHVCAAQYRRLIASYPSAMIIALTATPYRLDGEGLGSCGFTKIVHGPDTYELTEDGVLCPVRVYIPRSELTNSWSPEAAAERIIKTSFRKGVVFCRSVEESKETSRLLRGAGMRAVSVDGEMEAERRRKAFWGFERGRTKVICNHTIFTEGVDVPSVDLVVLNRHTLSRCLWKQMIGRGTRRAPNKTECTVLDLAGNGILHGSIYDREIYDLNGRVESTESRTLTQPRGDSKDIEYEHNQGEDLKEWKPQPKPIRIIENLRRLKSRSPLRRLRTAL